MLLFQEGYTLLQTVVTKLYINKEMCIFHNCFHCFDHPLYIFIQWLVLINLTTYSLTSRMSLYSVPVCEFACVYPFSVTEKKKVNYIYLFFFPGLSSNWSVPSCWKCCGPGSKSCGEWQTNLSSLFAGHAEYYWQIKEQQDWGKGKSNHTCWGKTTLLVVQK